MQRSRRNVGLTIVFTSALLGAALLAAWAKPPAVWAQAPVDAACRGCHGDNQRTMVLSSGEEVPLLVHLAEFDASAHGMLPDGNCTTCHSRDRYLYPHQALPAAITTLAEYSAAASQRCQDCHYGHNPFHGAVAEPEGAPTCVDCHGSHEIAPFDSIVESMPAQCLACHADQTTEWVQDLIAPREGLGAGAAGYAGSVRCLGCHEDLYLGWQQTRHARSVQNAVDRPDAVAGDFAIEHPERPFSLADVAYTVGGIRQQKYITRTAANEFFVLPAQWNEATEAWVSYHADDWMSVDWRESCAGCHVTGLDTDAWEFKEFGIGCESCHGPGLEHSQNPGEVKPYAATDDQVCGACHSRGESPEGLPHPATYHPGDVLAEHFTFTDSAEHLWPDGSARIHNQQYMDWQLGSSMALADSVNCVSCHTVHRPGQGRAQLNQPGNEVCLQCHNDKRKIIQHMPYHEVASQSYDFTCGDCHMPLMATSAIEFDTRSHSFLQPDPQASIDHGGLEMMPNACNQCHMDYGESPEWAVETIAYSASLRSQNVDNFGPGATPTSPPPPTPVPSVGEPVERMQVEAGGGLRIGLILGGGLLAILILAVTVGAVRHYVRTRSARHV